jgi:hypothetical protein
MARYLTHRFDRLAAIIVLAIASLAFATGAKSQSEPRHLTLLGIPSATVAPQGAAFASLQFTNQRPGPATGSDASLSFGVGFGDAENAIGVQLSAEITSTTDSLGDSGYFDLRFSRRISGGAVPTYLGIGARRLGGWGDASGIDPASDLTLTFFPFIDTPRGKAPLMISVGAGTHVRANQTEPGGYAGIGYGFNSSFAASASWYGDHAIIGVSYAPTTLQNVQFSAAVVDAFDSTNDRRAVFSVNLLFPKAF